MISEQNKRVLQVLQAGADFCSERSDNILKPAVSTSSILPQLLPSTEGQVVVGGTRTALFLCEKHLNRLY